MVDKKKNIPNIDMTAVSSALHKENKISLPGFQNLSAQCFITNKLIEDPPQKSTSAVLYLAKNKNDKDKLELLLKYFDNICPSDFKIINFEADNFDYLNLLLNNRKILLLACPDDMANPLPVFSKIKDNTINLKINNEYKIPEIKKLLIENDYNLNKTCQEPRDFAIRGNIVDIWLNEFTDPIRIEIDNNIITQIYSFDSKGKKLSDLKKLDLFSTNNAKVFKAKSWASQFDLLINDNDDDDLIDKFSNIINFSSLINFPEINLETNNIPSNLPTSILKQKINSIKPQYIFTNIDRLDISNSKIIKIPDFIYLESWFSKRLGILFLIKPKNKDKTKTASLQKQQLFFNKIKEGDLLVHQDHGVCKFYKMTDQVIDEISDEYLELHFAEGDKLYLPPYQIDKVSKYIGELNPKLNRLSGTTWLANLIKIREETLQLANEIIKSEARRNLISISSLKNHDQEKLLAADFPYELTDDQERALKEIENDLNNTTPMDRLLCGDVAFGKTEIALRTAYKAILNNKQVALLAPTTILVQQHFDLFKERLEPLGVKIGLLSRWQDTSQQKKTVEKLKNNELDLIIGTHRLLSSDVHFPNLGLLIIDEEQKFGVKDKEKLKRQKPHLHTLTLSATPIPRTLNYSMSGIRDISLIQTPPPGRLPINTQILPHENKTIKDALNSELNRGGQAYYLVRKVKEIPTVLKNLKKLMGKTRIGIAHGQLPARELARTMQDFDHGKIDILLCSTIIENGLDLPNVNTLVVDNAAHFGLSQLYQLRGRIGRSTKQGFAYFLFQRQKLTGLAQKRLDALKSSYELGSGFEIALRDLEIRGAGNLLGKEQHGEISSLGLNLYTQLLDESIKAIKSDEKQKPRLDVIIDLPIESTLSSNDIPTSAQRLSIYQQLSFIDNEKDLMTEAKKIFKEKWSDTIANMINVLELKLICEKVGIFEIIGKVLSHNPFNAKITLSLIPDHNSKNILRLLEGNDNWEYDGSKLKIKTENFKNKNWLEQLIKELKLLLD